MAKTISGAQIQIKAFLEYGNTIDDQLAALTAVKQAHTTGDYAALLAQPGIRIEAVRVDNIRKRVEYDTGSGTSPTLALDDDTLVDTFDPPAPPESPPDVDDFAPPAFLQDEQKKRRASR